MLGWSRRQLAEYASVAERTLIDFERGARQPHPRTLAAIRIAIEAAGIIFLPDEGEGPGLRLNSK